MHHFIRIILFLSFITLLSCGPLKPKKVDMRDNPVNMQERAKKNIREGKGVSLGSIVGNRGGNTTFEFSTSNPMWRASLEVLDFIPLSTVDYSGGMIISDWYSDSTKSNESIKVTIRFLSNEVRGDSLKIILHKKVCKSNQVCNVTLLSNSKIDEELRSNIIRKAALLEQESKEKKKN